MVFAYFAEFCIVNNRGQKLGFLLLFWVFGGIYVSGLGWLVIPQTRKSIPSLELINNVHVCLPNSTYITVVQSRKTKIMII